MRAIWRPEDTDSPGINYSISVNIGYAYDYFETKDTFSWWIGAK